MLPRSSTSSRTRTGAPDDTAYRCSGAVVTGRGGESGVERRDDVVDVYQVDERVAGVHQERFTRLDRLPERGDELVPVIVRAVGVVQDHRADADRAAAPA